MAPELDYETKKKKSFLENKEEPEIGIKTLRVINFHFITISNNKLLLASRLLQFKLSESNISYFVATKLNLRYLKLKLGIWT